jgi:hypothetical protein
LLSWPFPTPALRRPGRFVAVAALVGALGVGLTACGGSHSKAPKRPHLTAKQNDGIETIAKNVQKYCLQGGAHANIEREVDTLLTAYREKPTSIFTNSQGTESTMRQVVSAVAEELDNCGETSSARKLRSGLNTANG